MGRTTRILLLTLGLSAACSSESKMANRPVTDADVLRNLKEAGSDLSKPHAVNFYLYLPTEEAAQASARELNAAGLTTEVRTAAKGPGWLCLGTSTMVPTLEAITREVRRMEALARKHSGEYDGWETGVVP